MGLNMITVVADHLLSEEEFGYLGLEPTGRQTRVEDAIAVHADDEVVIISAGDRTVIADTGVCVTNFFEEPTLPLPGTWHAGCNISVTSFAYYVVYRDGELVRQLLSSQEESMDNGLPLIDETSLIYRGSDGEEDELLGEELVLELPVLTGALASSDGFLAAQGEVYRKTVGNVPQ